MADVRSFPGVTRVDVQAAEQPNQELIEFLEKNLADARSGMLQAVAIVKVAIRPGEGVCIGDGWSPGKGGYGHELMAGIGDLQYRFAAMRYEAGNVVQETPDVS